MSLTPASASVLSNFVLSRVQSVCLIRLLVLLDVHELSDSLFDFYDDDRLTNALLSFCGFSLPRATRRHF